MKASVHQILRLIFPGRFQTAMILLVAMVLVILLLSPWSPVSLTGGSDSKAGNQTNAVAQAGSGAALPLSLVPPSPTQTLSESPLALPSPTPVPTATTPSPAPQATPKLESSTEETVSPFNAVTQVPAEPPSEETAPRSLEELVLATESLDWKTRWDAVNDLGHLKDAKAIPALAARALYDDNSHPRWRSLWALSSVNPGGADAIPYLDAGLEDADPVVVRNAAVALAFFSQPQARTELLAGLHDQDSFRRWEAVFSLRNIGDSQVVDALIPLLDGAADPDTRVRGEVALNLGRIGGEGVAQTLLDALREDPSSQVRWRCAMSLGGLGDPSVVEAMKQVLLSEEDSQVREFIEKAIEKLQV